MGLKVLSNLDGPSAKATLKQITLVDGYCVPTTGDPYYEYCVDITAENYYCLLNGGSSKAYCKAEQAYCLAEDAYGVACKAYCLAEQAYCRETKNAYIDINECSGGSPFCAAWAQYSGGVAIGPGAYSFGTRSIAVGCSAIASSNQAGDTKKNAIAIGTEARAYGCNSIVIGDKSKDNSSENTIVIGHESVSKNGSSITIGQCSSSTGGFSVSIGYCSNIFNPSYETAPGGAISIGSNICTNGAYSIGIGPSVKALAPYSLVFGHSAESCSINACNSIVIGNNAKVGCTNLGGWRGVAIGSQATVYGGDAIAIGTEAKANGVRAIVIGNCAESVSTIDGGVVIGSYSKNNGYCSIVIGQESCNNGDYSVVTGTKSKTLDEAVAVGYNTYASDWSVSIGANAGKYVNEYGWPTCESNSAQSVAIGTGAVTFNGCSVAIGYDAESANRSIAIGVGSRACTDSGSQFEASVVIGANAKVGGLIGSVTDSGNKAIAIGDGASAFSTNISIGSDVESTGGCAGITIGMSTRNPHGHSIVLNSTGAEQTSPAANTFNVFTGGGYEGFFVDGTKITDKFASKSHTHAISDVTNLQTTLDSKAASSHTHTIANVTGLQSALDGKQCTLTAGSNITISGNVISASGGCGSSLDGYTSATCTRLGTDSEINGDCAATFGSYSCAGAYATALGNGAKAYNCSVAVGWTTQAKDKYSIAIGADGCAAGEENIIIGYKAKGKAITATAIGIKANAEFCSTAIGSEATATNGGLAIGGYTVARGDENDGSGNYFYGPLAIGTCSNAMTNKTIAIGNISQATKTGSVAIGVYATADACNSIVLNSSGGCHSSITANSFNVFTGNSCGDANFNSFYMDGTSLGSVLDKKQDICKLVAGDNVAFCYCADGTTTISATGETCKYVVVSEDGCSLSPSAAGGNSLAIGPAAVATQFGNTVVGARSSASGEYTTVFGSEASAVIDYSTVVGREASTKTYTSDGICQSMGAVAIGYKATSTYGMSIALGVNSESEFCGTALGAWSKAKGGGLAIGLGSETSLSSQTAASPAGICSSIAIGVKAGTMADSAIAIGNYSYNSGANSILIGTSGENYLSNATSIFAGLGCGAVVRGLPNGGGQLETLRFVQVAGETIDNTYYIFQYQERDNLNSPVGVKISAQNFFNMLKNAGGIDYTTRPSEES